MTVIPEDKLDRLVERWNAVQAELNKGPAQAIFVQLSKEFADLDPIVATIRERRRLALELADLESLIEDASSR